MITDLDVIIKNRIGNNLITIQRMTTYLKFNRKFYVNR